MAVVALKWDNNCIRVAVASVSRGSNRITFDQAMSVELSGETEDLSTSKLVDKLKLILNTAGITSRADVTVIVARGEIEMRQMELPPVPVDEIPDLVRFQARNHFTAMNDDWLVDYLPVSADESKTVVLAAGISGEQVKIIRDTVDAIGMRLKHIVVRPFAAIELLRSAQPSSECRVVLEIISREADISVVANDYVLMTRTVRVPDSYTDEQFDAWLPGEIRRTISSAQGQSGAKSVEHIVVCGSAREHEQLSKDLQQTLDIPCSYFQPLSSIHTSSKFEQPPRQDGFASLLGSLVQSTQSESHAVDFLNPRKKSTKTFDKKKWTVIGTVAAALLLLTIGTFWWMFRTRNAEIARLQKENSEIAATAESFSTVIQHAERVDKWKSRQIDWLEELHQVSQRLPDPEITRVNLIIGKVSDEYASVDMRGLLTEPDWLPKVEEILRNRPYKVEPRPERPSEEEGFKTLYEYLLIRDLPKVGLDGNKIYPSLIEADSKEPMADEAESPPSQIPK